MNYYNLKGCLEQQILNNYYRVLNYFSSLVIGLDYKAEEHKNPILMTSQNFDTFIIQETNTRLKSWFAILKRKII